MAVSDVEAVLEFLRKNGFSKVESALREDMVENSDLGSFDFENVLSFPMVPPPPPVRIPATSWKLEPLAIEDCSKSSSLSSDDEFVSLGPSASDTSSDFINPYGIKSPSRGISQASSSDRLSQFGTARDWPDFNMQNNIFRFDDKDDVNFMSPCFKEPDFIACPSEDKFVMLSEAEKHFDSPSILYKPCLIHNDKNQFSSYNEYSKNNVEEIYSSKLEDYSYYPNLKDSSLDDLQLKNVQDITTDHDSDLENNYLYIWIDGVEKFSAVNVKEKHQEIEIKSDEEGLTENENLMYKAQEEEYEVFDLRIIHRKNRTGFEANKDLPVELNSIIAGRYYVTGYIGSAAFSKVVQAHDLHMGVDVSLKIIKNSKEFLDQSLDEIKLLKLVNKYDPADDHHILRLYDYFYHQEHLFIVCELLRANLYEFQKFSKESGREVYFTPKRLQVITRQCLEGLEYLHDLGIIHCDLKPENILMKSYKRCEIKIIDLGSSCFQSDNLCLYVQSRSYRAPEVILGLSYDPKIDIWSLGCILSELCSGKVLFPNDGVVMILARMIGMFGPFDLEMLLRGEETYKYFTREFDLYHENEGTEQVYITPWVLSLEDHLQVKDVGFIEFVRYLLEMNPKRRPTASEALKHPWLSYSYDSNSL